MKESYLPEILQICGPYKPEFRRRVVGLLTREKLRDWSNRFTDCIYKAFAAEPEPCTVTLLADIPDEAKPESWGRAILALECLANGFTQGGLEELHGHALLRANGRFHVVDGALVTRIGHNMPFSTEPPPTPPATHKWAVSHHRRALDLWDQGRVEEAWDAFLQYLIAILRFEFWKRPLDETPVDL
jgi:hypothetical protein